ncbi:hypothetical protein KAR91_12940, partial [Candidatus Pacearchaeota archaeon]|nr:hypothetical protein [Candidatus Pacearchaeota archaeon]
MATEKFDIPSLEEIDEIKDNTQLIGYDPDSLDTVKHKNFTFQTLREKMSELIVFLTGLRLNPSRIAMQELTSGSLSVSGWYTIAETLTSAFQPASSKFNIIVGGAGQAGSIEFIAQISQSTSLKTNINSKIEILGSSSTNTNGILGIRGVRIAKSDSVSNAGSKLQVNIVVSPTVTL